MRPRLVRRFVSIASKAMPRLWTSPKPVARNGTSRSPSATAVAARDSCGRPRVAWRTEIRSALTRATREPAASTRNQIISERVCSAPMRNICSWEAFTSAVLAWAQTLRSAT